MLPRSGCQAETCRRYGRRCMRSGGLDLCRGTGVSAGPRLMPTSSTWIGLRQRYCRAHCHPPSGPVRPSRMHRNADARCWCCSTALRDHRPAITRWPLPTLRASVAPRSRWHTSAAAAANSTTVRAPTTRAISRRSTGSCVVFARFTPAPLWRSASRLAATPCCVGPARWKSRRRPWFGPWPQCLPRSTSRPAGTRLAVDSTGWSIRVCS